MPCNIPSALAEIAKGRDYLKTAEFARVIGKASQTIRKLNCLDGQAFGIRPIKIGNSLLWSVDCIAHLLNGGK